MAAPMCHLTIKFNSIKFNSLGLLVTLNNYFLSTFHDLGMSQIVDFPTRLDKTLDLSLTTRPTLVNKCIPPPGVSDHEMVFTISDVRDKCLKPTRRKILLWKEGWNGHRQIPTWWVCDHISLYQLGWHSTPVDDLWNKLTSGLLCASKISSTRLAQI